MKESKKENQIIEKKLSEIFEFEEIKLFGDTTVSTNSLVGNFCPKLDSNYKPDPDLLQRILMWWVGFPQEGLFLTGPSGAGKSSMIRYIAAKLNYNMQQVTGHGRLEFQELISNIHLLNGQSVVMHGPLARAMKNGHLFLLDEADLIDPSANAALNEILQGKPLIVPETNELIEPHPMFRFVATGNSNGGMDDTGMYSGVVSQNMAFMDRFTVISVNYLPPKEEIEILKKNFPHFSPGMCSRFVEVANVTRSAFSGVSTEHSVELTFSTRTLMRWAKYTSMFSTFSDPEGIRKALYMALGNRASSTTKVFFDDQLKNHFG